MAVVGIIFKVIGWILLSVLALVVIALCIRVKLAIKYSDKESSVVLQYLFLKIPLYPMKKKAKKEAPAEEEPEEEEEEPAEEEPEEEKPPKPKGQNTLLADFYNANGIDGIILLLKRICSTFGTFFGDLLKVVVIEELQLDMACAKKDDAAETAIYYGEVCAKLFPLLGALASKCRMKKHRYLQEVPSEDENAEPVYELSEKTYDINVYPDFLANYSRTYFFARIHFTPAYIIGIAIAFGCRFVFKALLPPIVKTFLQMIKKNKKAGNSDIPQAKNNNEKREQSV